MRDADPFAASKTYSPSDGTVFCKDVSERLEVCIFHRDIVDG